MIKIKRSTPTRNPVATLELNHGDIAKLRKFFRILFMQKGFETLDLHDCALLSEFDRALAEAQETMDRERNT